MIKRHFQIKNRFTDAVIHEGDYVSIYEAIADAVKSRADLSRADLSRANLSRANLYGAKIDLADKSARLAWKRTRILTEGDLIGWKKANEGRIVKLLIPAKARRSHAFGRKCRAEFAKVLAIFGLNDAPCKTAETNYHGPRTIYEVGKTVKPDGWNEDWQVECGQGIHFYITKEEAMAH